MKGNWNGENVIGDQHIKHNTLIRARVNDAEEEGSMVISTMTLSLTLFIHFLVDDVEMHKNGKINSEGVILFPLKEWTLQTKVSSPWSWAPKKKYQ